MAAAIAVIGIGNTLRGDDGVGLALLRALRPDAPDRVDLCESDGEVTRLLEMLADRDAVVLVDAVVTGAAPGTVHCWHWHTAAPQMEALRSSTHTLSVVDALALAEALGRKPGAVVIIGVEAQQFTPGAALTPAVAEAMIPALEKLQRELRLLLGEESRVRRAPHA